ncbi:MAG: hypothetical protein WA459_02995, partial [Stellaceae bacterium]
QERGAYKHDYRPGTLREKLFGHSRLLPPSHPAAAHRPPADSADHPSDPATPWSAAAHVPGATGGPG